MDGFEKMISNLLQILMDHIEVRCKIHFNTSDNRSKAITIDFNGLMKQRFSRESVTSDSILSSSSDQAIHHDLMLDVCLELLKAHVDCLVSAPNDQVRSILNNEIVNMRQLDEQLPNVCCTRIHHCEISNASCSVTLVFELSRAEAESAAGTKLDSLRASSSTMMDSQTQDNVREALKLSIKQSVKPGLV